MVFHLHFVLLHEVVGAVT